MKNQFLSTLLPAAGISILAALPCVAQTAIVPSSPQGEAAPPQIRARQIPLRYVKPGVMAWWLDPKNHPQPAGATPELRFKALPEGVDRIIPIDPQNTLLVFGSDEGVRELADTIQFLDRPGDRIPLKVATDAPIAVEARLVTVKTENLSGIWAALSQQVGHDTPAAAFLKSDEELQLGEQIGRHEASFERTQTLTIAGDAKRVLDFGPAASFPDTTAWQRDFSSAMPVIPPPKTSEMPNPGLGKITRLLPAPLGNLRLLVGAATSPDNAIPSDAASPGAAGISLQLNEISASGILGRSGKASFELRGGETLALALPDSTPQTRAFLLLSASRLVQFAPLYRAPNLSALPGIGGLFKTPIAPQKSPEPVEIQ